METPILLLVIALVTIFVCARKIIRINEVERQRFEIDREQRRDYYRNVYLKSEEWQRKRYVVLKRDNWTCVYCGAPATEVHHLRYAKYNIGKEPIEWLVSVCRHCHEQQHG